MMDMDWDDIALERFDEQKREWILLLRKSTDGLFNLICPLRGHEIISLLLEAPSIAVFASMFRDEKTRNEVAVMQYIKKNTKIPVPRIISHGMSHENPSGLGPFIIMEWVDGKNMSEILCGSSSEDSEERGRELNPEIDVSLLKVLYGRMADILLELWDNDFDAIGGLHMETTGSSTDWTVKNERIGTVHGYFRRIISKRPLSHHYRLYIGPCKPTVRSCLGTTKFRNSQDCREKYTCRHLFRALVPYFLSKHRADNRGPFKLFCDDLNPGNVLVDERTLEVTTVIDWEFTYAAPSFFTTSAPWWLLLTKPEYWSGTTDNFVEEYTPRLNLFLEVMKERETFRSGENECGAMPLSSRMQRSMTDRSFWFTHAIRNTLNVDGLYWSNLDVHCYGPRASIAERVYKFTTIAPMHHDREAFTRRKLDDLRQYHLERGEEQVEYDEVEEYLKAENQLFGQPTPLRPETKDIPSKYLPSSTFAWVAGTLILGIATAIIQRNFLRR
ncbi:hypothetical protein LOZ66_003933 [Ophidiomyces ophidiicola]|nr:hypothetical protein LOZ66_003933 [Ophidiomyces ophidiicola]